MKPVDAGSFQRRKDINEVGKGRNEDFDIYIFYKNVIYIRHKKSKIILL